MIDREKGFEAGVAFTLRHLTDNEHNVIDISKFVGEISNLRTWKSAAEWDDFVKRNIVEDNYG